MTSEISLFLVDDDEAFRGIMSSELERMGFRVLAAGSGKEALERLESFSPDVVLLDLRLPDLSGLEVLPLLKEREPEAEVIMLTGHGSIDSADVGAMIAAIGAYETTISSTRSGNEITTSTRRMSTVSTHPPK